MAIRKESQWPVHECPPWCHACPLMAGGAVMPMCWGSVCSYADEYDLSACTCDPNDPAVARRELSLKTETLLRLLRNKRRARLSDRIQTKKLVKMVGYMKFWTIHDFRRNLPDLVDIAHRLNRAEEEL